MTKRDKLSLALAGLPVVHSNASARGGRRAGTFERICRECGRRYEANVAQSQVCSARCRKVRKLRKPMRPRPRAGVLP